MVGVASPLGALSFLGWPMRVVPLSFCAVSERASGNDFSNKLICLSVAPQIPSGLGPTSELIIHWLRRLLEREKRQAWEKGPEEKLVVGGGHL